MDADYDYGKPNEFPKCRSLDAIVKAIWRALNPVLNQIRNLKDYTKWRNLYRVLYRVRTNMHKRHWRQRLELRHNYRADLGLRTKGYYFKTLKEITERLGVDDKDRAFLRFCNFSVPCA